MLYICIYNNFAIEIYTYNKNNTNTYINGAFPIGFYIQ